jgi:hypothetical protein
MADASDTQQLRVPVIAVGLASLLSVAAGLLIALRQLDGLVGQVLDDGVAHTPTMLSGLSLPWREPEGWRFLFGEGQGMESRLDDWLTGYAVLDLAFALTYGVLLLWWCLATGVRWWVWKAVAVGVLADLVEGGLVLAGWAAPLPWVSCVKSIALLSAFLSLVVCSRAEILTGLRRLAQGLYTHRYSAVIVLPVALLGLGAGPDLLEQLPDIQRRWADDGEGARHFVAAGVVTLLLAVAAFATGRQRSDHLHRRTTQPLPRADEPRASLALWFLGPALLALGGEVARRNGAPVAPWPFWIFVGIPLAIGVGSAVIRLVWQPDPHQWRKQRGTVGAARFRAAALVGDLLPGALLVVAGLGAIRSFTAVVALGHAGWAWLFLVLGWVAVLGTWWGYAVALRHLAKRADASPGRLVVLLTPGLPPSPRRRQWVAWVVFIGCLTLGLWLAMWPSGASRALGVLATFQLALGALSLLIASVVLLLQPGGAPEVFWRRSPFAMPFVPVTTLVVAACLSAAVFGGNSEVHGLRAYPSPEAQPGSEGDAVGERPGIPALFTQWLESEHRDTCLISAERGLSIRPLLLYAAEGGGIRAAYWTASGVDKLYTDVGEDECGGAFLSSGASGGAVGLSVASVTDPGAARSAVEDISGPDPLAAAVAGLVIRDTVYAATGVPLPPFRSQEDDGYVWVDRAALIEEAWEDQIEKLGDPWLEGHETWDWPTSGAMVLNSTSATTGCRAVLSQLALGAFGDSGCTNRPGLAGSTDLLACTGQLRTSTVALLASRFPYVTPSASHKCGTEQQYVDGGYAENTGVGTLVDLSPKLLAEVRSHNDCVLGAGSKAACRLAPTTVVVPMLLYFDNGSGADLLRTPPKPALELLVPPLAALKAKKSLYSAESQLQRARAALHTTQLWSAETKNATLVARAVDGWRGCESVYVMYQRTRPGIAAPLGWVLSEASRRPMDGALREQDEVTRDLPYGTIDELISLLRLHSLEPGASDSEPCPRP